MPARVSRDGGAEEPSRGGTDEGPGVRRRLGSDTCCGRYVTGR